MFLLQGDSQWYANKKAALCEKVALKFSKCVVSLALSDGDYALVLF